MRAGAPASPATTSSVSSVSVSSVSVSSVPAASGWPAHVHARCGGVGPLGDGEVHPDLPSVQLRSSHGVTGLSRVLAVLEIEESKAPATAGVTVQDDLDLLKGSEFLKLCL